MERTMDPGTGRMLTPRAAGADALLWTRRFGLLRPLPGRVDPRDPGRESKAGMGGDPAAGHEKTPSAGGTPGSGILAVRFPGSQYAANHPEHSGSGPKGRRTAGGAPVPLAPTVKGLPRRYGFAPPGLTPLRNGNTLGHALLQKVLARAHVLLHVQLLSSPSGRGGRAPPCACGSDLTLQQSAHPQRSRPPLASRGGLFHS